MELFVKASETSFGTTIHKTRKCCYSKTNDYIKNALSGIMTNDLKFPLINSVERIRQQHFTHFISKFSKHSSPRMRQATTIIVFNFIIRDIPC